MSILKELSPVIAPNLSKAMNTPFNGLATRFLMDSLQKDQPNGSAITESLIREMLLDAKKLAKIKEVDKAFAAEMKTLEVDLAALAPTATIAPQKNRPFYFPQLAISVVFLLAYFAMLAFIFVVEVSDEMNMQKGENSLMGELQILFGVMTAGVGQIMSYWFSYRDQK